MAHDTFRLARVGGTGDGEEREEEEEEKKKEVEEEEEEEEKGGMDLSEGESWGEEATSSLGDRWGQGGAVYSVYCIRIRTRGGIYGQI